MPFPEYILLSFCDILLRKKGYRIFFHVFLEKWISKQTDKQN